MHVLRVSACVQATRASRLIQVAKQQQKSSIHVCIYKGHAATAFLSSQECQDGQAMSEIRDAATAVSASGVSEAAAPASY